MSPFRYRDDDSSTGTTIATALIGAVAGFAVGMFVAQRLGGFGGIAGRFQRRSREETTRPAEDAVAVDAYDEIASADDADESLLEADSDDGDDEVDDDFNGMDDDGTPLLEERVLEAFNNDPILAERAIDIGTIGSGIIELAGWVDTDDEAEHAVTIARGVPGVETVVNRLMVDDEEHQLEDATRRFREGDASLTETKWEGQQVGTGKRRQGTSEEIDRHADPKPVLEDRWLSEREALRNAADDVNAIAAEPRKRGRGAKAPRADQPEPPPEA